MAHYDAPLDLALRYDGWYSREAIDLFARYVETICTRYRNKAKYWITFNEIDSIIRHPWASAALVRDRFEGKDFDEVCRQAMHHQFVASARATEICHRIIPGSMVGGMITKLTYYPYTCKPEDVLAATRRMRSVYAYSDTQVFGEYPKYLLTEYRNSGWNVEMTPEDLDMMRENPVDFVAFSYYMSSCEAADTTGLDVTPGNTVLAIKNPHLPTTDWGWQTDPWGCASRSSTSPTAIASRSLSLRTAWERWTSSPKRPGARRLPHRLPARPSLSRVGRHPRGWRGPYGLHHLGLHRFGI